MDVRSLLYSPAAQSSIYHFHNNVCRFFDLRNRSIFYRYEVGPLEDDGFHGVFGHCGCWFLPCRSRFLGWEENSKMQKVNPKKLAISPCTSLLKHEVMGFGGHPFYPTPCAFPRSSTPRSSPGPRSRNLSTPVLPYLLVAFGDPTTA